MNDDLEEDPFPTASGVNIRKGSNAIMFSGPADRFIP